MQQHSTLSLSIPEGDVPANCRQTMTLVNSCQKGPTVWKCTKSLSVLWFKISVQKLSGGYIIFLDSAPIHVGPTSRDYSAPADVC